MLRSFSPLRRKTGKSFASAFAMAMALAGGTVVATAGYAPVAAAEDYSRAFVSAYSPVAEVVNAEGGDISTVSAQFPAVVAAATTPDDMNAAGNLLLMAGNKTSNTAWQRQGLELQLASGKLPPEAVGQYQWFVGNLAYQQDDYEAARTALLASQAAGWTDDATGLIAETYFGQDDTTGGVNYIISQVESRAGTANPVAQNWVLRALQASYDADMLEPSIALSKLLVQNYTSQQNWINALQVVNALSDYDDQGRLDMLRLMRVTNALTDPSEYARYIETADPRIMSNEVSGVLAEMLAGGHIERSDVYYTEINDVVQARMAQDRADAPELVADANAEANGEGAMSAGDVLWSLGDYAGAEEMYALAITKGGIDTNTALTRQGMSQARQGKAAEAQATLAQVTGPRAPVAAMWSAWAAANAN